MVNRAYDPDRLNDPDYVKWLKSWNVDVDNLPEMKAKNGGAQRVVEGSGDNSNSEGGSTKTPQETNKDPNSSVPAQTQQQTAVTGTRADKDYDKWSLEDLQAKAGELEISKSGTKADLAKRIRETEA